MTAQQIIFLIVLATTIYIMITEKKSVPAGQTSQEPLTKKLKVVIWVLCIFNPLIAGTILYYGWKKKLPVKAHKANQISLWAFFILIVIGIGLFFVLPPSL